LSDSILATLAVGQNLTYSFCGAVAVQKLIQIKYSNSHVPARCSRFSLILHAYLQDNNKIIVKFGQNSFLLP
jgi:hypothetical protein